MLIISYAHSYHMHTHIYDYEQIVYEHIIIIISVVFAIAIHLKTNRMLPQKVGGGTISVTYMGTTLSPVVHMVATYVTEVGPILPIILVILIILITPRPPSSRRRIITHGVNKIGESAKILTPKMPISWLTSLTSMRMKISRLFPTFSVLGPRMSMMKVMILGNITTTTTK